MLHRCAVVPNLSLICSNKSAQSCSSLNVDLSIQIKAPDFEILGLHLKRNANVLKAQSVALSV